MGDLSWRNNILTQPVVRAEPGYISSGGCNNKLRPLPQPARHPLVELVDGVLVVCGDLRECWTYSPGNDSWTPTWSLSQERRQASSVSLGGRLFVTGGYLPGQGTFNSTEVQSGAF